MIDIIVLGGFVLFIVALILRIKGKDSKKNKQYMAMIIVGLVLWLGGSELSEEPKSVENKEVAQTSEDKSEEKEEPVKAEEKKGKTFTLGEAFNFKSWMGEYNVTINSVEKDNDSLIINYGYENISYDLGLSIWRNDFTVSDQEGNVLEDNITGEDGLGKETTPGTKTNATIRYKLNGSNKVIIQYTREKENIKLEVEV